jgi:hypothetical protein
MMGDRRVVIVLRAERLLKPKRRGKADVETGEEGDVEAPTDLDALKDFVEKPGSMTTLVLVAADIDKSRRAGKAILKHATVVECWGLKLAKDARGSDLRGAARVAEQMVKKAVAEAGQHIEAPAAQLLANRAGFDIARLRGDLERLMLYTVGKTVITRARRCASCRWRSTPGACRTRSSASSRGSSATKWPTRGAFPRRWRRSSGRIST